MMGRVIKGQVIASTAVDSHGEFLSEETIRTLFEQLQDPSLSFRNHDTSQLPVSRGFNKRLERRPDGTLAIVIDLEVLDEAGFATAGGFSIAFTNRTMRFGTNPALRILINPRQFDFDLFAQGVGRLLPEGESVDVTERIEKAAGPTEVIIIVSFVAGAIATGFLNKVGSDLFDYLKSRRARESPTTVTIHLDITAKIRARPVVVLLVADPRATPRDIADVDVDALCARVEAFASGVDIQRAVGIILPGGSVELRFVVLPDGTTKGGGDRVA